MTRQSLLVASAASLSSLVVGVAVGYKVAEKRLTVQFDERLRKETEGMREFYTVHRKTYPNPQAAAADLIPANSITPEKESASDDQEKVAYHKIARDYSPMDGQGEEHTVDSEDGEVAHHNVFETKTDPDKPYIVTQDDFMQNDAGYVQATLTYYEKDRVLTDEKEDPIEDQDAVVGLDTFVNFGTGSSDENTVHVRNERLQMDFEVVRNESSYAREVLGEDDIPIQRPSGRKRGG